MDPDPTDPDLPLTRRGFGRLTALGAAALALPRPARATAEPAGAADLRLADGPNLPVAVAGVPRGSEGAATERAVRETVLGTTDFSWLSRGDSVLIKVSCNSGNVYPATTDPIALRTMIGLLRERGAGRVIVADMSGVEAVRFSKDETRGSSRELLHSAGLAQVAEDAGAEVQAFEEAGWDGFYEEAPAAKGSWKNSLFLPEVLREADHVVLMPRCSRHLLAGSTLALKCAVGWWRHDSRLEYHHDASTFAQKTADANTVPSLREKQRLVVTSATKVMALFGPDDGRVVAPETGIVFASVDAVAHDLVSLSWLLSTRASILEEKRAGLMDDPNTSPTVVNFANRVVNLWLGGIGKAVSAERLRPWPATDVWNDRVMQRAFENSGGVPPVELAYTGGVPMSLQESLTESIRLPSS
ncbi:MAG: hypothetical protein CL910_22225 [Deltaproteobacteria bacterium]|jgi:uncharacterized protein (DUF362 family)|nr:hypothetical protein [Deltaproteobacteria bacterium]